MLILNPEIVRFESHAWDDVAALAIDRAAKRLIEDHSDEGPHAAFIDVPEQTITIRVQRRLTADDTDDPTLGQAGTLIFYLAQPGADATRKRVTITCTVTAIRCDLPTAGKPATKTITLLAHSTDGTDPLTTTDAALAE